MHARWLTAVALLGATAAAHSQTSAVARVLAGGEQLLAAGDAAAAEAAFDRAAAAAHDHDIEISLVRAYMQAGEYRRALAFAAHAAGAHGDEPAASALYGWLLAHGGQQQVARRLLDSALAASPDDATLKLATARLAEPWPVADDKLLAAPVRFAPYAYGAVAAGAVASSATLAADGRRVLAPAGALPPSFARLWVRNGLGRTVAAEVERRLDIAGIELVLLSLESPLPVPPEQTAAARAPFAGSVGYAVEYADGPSSEAAWPLLTLGFFGRSAGGDALQALGIGVPPGPRGGPAFDDAGRVVGVTARAGDGSDRLVAAAVLPADIRPLLGIESPGGPTPRRALDVIYERALLLTLQLIVASPDGG